MSESPTKVEKYMTDSNEINSNKTDRSKTKKSPVKMNCGIILSNIDRRELNDLIPLLI